MSDPGSPRDRSRGERHVTSDMTLGEALDWALNGKLTEQELVEARALLAEMDKVALENKRDIGESRVLMVPPS